MAPFTSKANREFASEWIDGLAKAHQFLAVRVHEVNIFRKRLTQCLGHCLHSTIGDKATTNFRFDLFLHSIDTGLKFIALKAFFKRRQRVWTFLLRLFHEAFENAIKIEIP